MKEIRTEIVIDAAVNEVWSILTDFSRHGEWNPFIRKVSGELCQGAQLQVVLGPPGKRAMRFKPIVQLVEPEKAFRWLGHLFVSGLFDGEHIFELETAGKNATRFIQREKFNGILVGIFRKSLDTDIKSGFIAMNEALKKEAEKSSRQS
ncbi:hypothetical protein D1BOALGB6SA_8309 [Olavius sp. associated proteobacterium Delta 1]|nr:hypothetical protein D1BOALGB6SA_8309 [Olavius sp. associated proteobacterium Delta 1]